MDGGDLHTIVVGREAMGCRFEVVFNAGEVAEATELGCGALDLVDEIEARISVYRGLSELSAINQAAGEWVAVSSDTLALLELARGLSAATAGGFDVAAGPLVRVWGFLRRQGRTPGDAELAAALAVSGTRWLELDPAGGRARLTATGAELNPGAIGKGWAIDHAVDWLRAAGVASVLVHGGQSSVRACGIQGPSLPGRSGWKVGLRHPRRPGRRLATITLDPRTGRPAEGVISATVLAGSAAEADALATALYVLGEEGLERVAPAGGSKSAVLVVAAAPGGLRVVVANLGADAIAIAPEPGLAVDWKSAAVGGEPAA
jgi:thiamine biosynthesis lipoprotein